MRLSTLRYFDLKLSYSSGCLEAGKVYSGYFKMKSSTIESQDLCIGY